MMKLKKLVLQTTLALTAATGLSAASSAQDVNYDFYYFEGTTWNSYHGTTDEHQGTPPQICEAIAKSYDRQDTFTNYTSTVEGIYNDSYSMVMNPSGTVRWISCSIDVKTTNHYFSTGKTTVSQNYVGGILVVTKEEPRDPPVCPPDDCDPNPEIPTEPEEPEVPGPCTLYFMSGYISTLSKMQRDACLLGEQYLPVGYEFKSLGYTASGIDLCIFKYTNDTKYDITRPIEQRSYQQCPQ